MINKVILIGRMGKDPDVKEINRGSQNRVVANFPLATHESYTDRRTRERIEKVEWHTVEMWDKMAENASKILKKGRLVYIEGKLKSESWLDAEGGKHYKTKIVASIFQVLHFGNSNKPKPYNDGDEDSDEDDVDFDSEDFETGFEDEL